MCVTISAAMGAVVLLAHASHAAHVRVRGREVLVDDRPLFFKGVNWNPVAEGQEQTQGGVDFRGFVEADSEIMAAAGINVVRTYAPISDPTVLDVFWKKGIYVMNTVYTQGDEDIHSIEGPIVAVRHHPAVLMWCVGNEWNYNMLYSNLTFGDVLTRVNKVAALIKQIDPSRPVATVYGAMPPVDHIDALGAVDVWGLTVYTGLSFGNVFKQWASRTGKPMFLAEFGADAFDTRRHAVNEEAQAKATELLTREIAANAVQRHGGVCSGGLVFELADEWWKDGSGSPKEHNVGGVSPGGGPFPDRVFNEEFWGLVRIDGTPRRAFHTYASMQDPGQLMARNLLKSSTKHVDVATGRIGPGFRLRACGASPHCRGLLGDCCPTLDGVFHDCCSAASRNASKELAMQSGSFAFPEAIATRDIDTTAGERVSATTTSSTTAIWNTPTVPPLATIVTTRLQAPAFPDRQQKLPGTVKFVKHELVATISIGTPEQQFRCLLDSRTSGLWIPSSRCRGCRGGHLFSVDQSSTYTPEFKKDASGADGLQTLRMAHDSFRLAGLLVRDTIRFSPRYKSEQSFVLIEEATLPSVRAWDAVCGVARALQPRRATFQGQNGRALMTILPTAPGLASIVVGEVPAKALRTAATLAWVEAAQPAQGSNSDGTIMQALPWIFKGGLQVTRPEAVIVHFSVDFGVPQAVLAPPQHYDTFVRSLLPNGFIESGHCTLGRSGPVSCDCAVVQDTGLPSLTVHLSGHSFAVDVSKLFLPGQELHDETRCYLQVMPKGGSDVEAIKNMNSRRDDPYHKRQSAVEEGLSKVLDGFLNDLVISDEEKDRPGSEALEGALAQPVRTPQASLDSDDNVWVLGSLFLSHFVVAFDFDRSLFGLGRPAHEQQDESTLPPEVAASLAKQFLFAVELKTAAPASAAAAASANGIPWKGHLLPGLLALGFVSVAALFLFTVRACRPSRLGYEIAYGAE